MGEKEKQKKISIKILRAIILLTLFAMMITMAGSALGAYRLKKHLRDEINEIKMEQQAANNRQILDKIKDEIRQEVSAQAFQYTETFKQYVNAISLFKNMVRNTYENPREYGIGEVIIRGSENTDRAENKKMSMYYCLPKGMMYDDVKVELERIGSLKNVIASIAEYSGVSAIYYASEDGYMIAIDDNSEARMESMVDMDNPEYLGAYDPRQRDWYKKALEVEMDECAISKIYKDIDGNDVITWSAAVVVNGKKKGVVAMDIRYSNISILAAPHSDREYVQYSEIINEDGEPVLKFGTGEFEYINIFDEPEFEKSAEELKNQKKTDNLQQDNIRTDENLVSDEVNYKDREYLMSGTNISGTNLYFIHFVDKNETEAYQAELQQKLQTFQSIQNKFENITVNMLIFFAILFFIVFFIMIIVSRIVSARISKPIQNLIHDVQIIGGGNLKHQVDIHTGDELEQLGAVFNRMTLSLKNYMENLRQVAMEQERISTELNVAASIQLDMLPRVFPAFPGEISFDIRAFMHPAKEVGGDYYDYFMLDEKHLVTVVADVSGKGVPAALFMMMGKTLMRSQAAYLNNPAEIMEAVNKGLNENNEEMMFITGFFSILNLVTGELIYANAGHNAPLLYRAEKGEYEYIKEDADLVLGIMEDTTYKEHSLLLSPGDKFFLYTDGVTEAADIKGRLYGEEHLRELMNRKEMLELSGEALIKALNQDIQEFANGAGQADDITMVWVSYKEYKQIEEKEDGKRKLTVGANLANLERVLGFVEEILRDKNVPEKTITKVQFVLDEMFTNIASYAYPDRNGEVVIICELSYKQKIIIHLEDGGIAYNPLDREKPDVELPVESREIGGLGIFLVKNMVDEMKYCYEEGRNKLTLEISWLGNGESD